MVVTASATSRSAFAAIPATSEATFKPASAPLSPGTPQVLVGHGSKPRSVRQRQGPGPVRSKTPDWNRRTRSTSGQEDAESRIYEMPLASRSNPCLDNTDSPAPQGHSHVTTRSPHPPIGGFGLSAW